MPLTRLVTSFPVAAAVCLAGFVSPASAQVARTHPDPVTQVASAAQGELQGVVTDEIGRAHV